MKRKINFSNLSSRKRLIKLMKGKAYLKYLFKALSKTINKALILTKIAVKNSNWTNKTAQNKQIWTYCSKSKSSLAPFTQLEI